LTELSSSSRQGVAYALLDAVAHDREGGRRQPGGNGQNRQQELGS